MHLSHLALAMALMAGEAHAGNQKSGSGYRKQQSIGREAQSRLIADPEFRIEQLDLDVFDLAAASSLRGSDALLQLPASDSPIGAVLRLVHAYALGRVDAYGATMTEDFRFLFAGEGSGSKYPDGFGREDEMKSLEHLVHGFVDRQGIARPRARSMRLRVDHIQSIGDSDFPEDPVGHAVVCLRARMEILLVTGETLGAFEGIQHFTMVRGDRALAPPGAARGADHWYVRRWQEFATGDEAVAAAESSDEPDAGRRPAAPAERSGEERDSVSAALRQGEALRFSLAVPSLIRSGAIRAVVTLAVPERARLDLFDVGGRRVAWRELEGREPGRFEISVAAPGELAGGVYWLRLVQGPRSAIARVSLLR